jgi:hypothetical protein
MSNLENWEEIISSKFDGQQIPFNEGDWDRAEEMIEKAEVKLKRKRWFNIYFLGIASGALVMLLAAKLFFGTDNSTKRLTENSSKQNANVNTVPSDKLTGVNSGQNSTVVINQAPSVNPVVSSENSASQKNVADEKMNQLKEENKELKNKLEEQKNQNQFLAGKVNEMNSALAKAQDPAVHYVIRYIDSLRIDPKTVAPVQLVPDEIVQNNQLADKVHILKNPDAENIGTLQSNLVKKEDSTHFVYQNPNPVLDLPAPPVDTTHAARSRNNVFSFEAGANYIAGWKYHDTLEGRGFNEVLGFDYTHHFNPKWAMSTAVRFERIGYLSVSQKQVIDSTPDFGLNNKSTVISPERLFYFSLPVTIERTVNAKNTFGAGASFSYLFNTTSILQTVNTTDGYKTVIGEPKREYAYFGGLSRVDVAFTLSYRRQLFPKWGLLLEGTYGLMDLKSDSYFSNSHDKTEHIMGARFMLTYKLF